MRCLRTAPLRGLAPFGRDNGRLARPAARPPAVLRGARALRHQLEFVRNVVELCERCDPHLAHDVAAMHLDRRLGDAHVTRNLLIPTALGDLNHDPALTERQHFESCPERTQSFVLLAPDAVTSEPEIDSVQKVLVTERLREELDGAAL